MSGLNTGIISKYGSIENKDEDPSWIGFDLDGTMAFYNGWKGHAHIGVPIPKIVALAKSYLEQGKKIRIVTARVNSTRPPVEREEARSAIEQFCLDNLGQIVPVTSEKDEHMLYMYCDRVKQVITNTGIVV